MSTAATGAPGSAPGPAPAEAEKVEPKKKAKAKKAKEPSAAARPRLPKYPDDHVVTVIKENAKARGAADRFKRYKTGMTVRAYVEEIKKDFSRTEGQIFADLRWDEDHKFIAIGPTVVDVPKPEPAPAKGAKAEATPAAA